MTKWRSALRQPVVGAGEHAANSGDVICRWVNDKQPGSSQTVLTDGPSGSNPGIYYNLSEGDELMISQLCLELVTASDDVYYELGYTDQEDGAGTFTPITPRYHIQNGANFFGFQGEMMTFVPPVPVNYASGARSVTARVDANDAGATIIIAWHGYKMETS